MNDKLKTLLTSPSLPSIRLGWVMGKGMGVGVGEMARVVVDNSILICNDGDDYLLLNYSFHKKGFELEGYWQFFDRHGLADTCSAIIPIKLDVIGHLNNMYDTIIDAIIYNGGKAGLRKISQIVSFELIEYLENE